MTALLCSPPSPLEKDILVSRTLGPSSSGSPAAPCGVESDWGRVSVMWWSYCSCSTAHWWLWGMCRILSGLQLEPEEESGCTEDARGSHKVLLHFTFFFFCTDLTLFPCYNSFSVLCLGDKTTIWLSTFTLKSVLVGMSFKIFTF